MTIRLGNEEFERFLAAPKVSLGPLKYKAKQNQSYHESKVVLRCADFPEINLALISTYNKTANPRKITLLLMANSMPVLRLDVNPGGIHTNVISGETFYGLDSHWHVYPDMGEAIAANSNLTHKQWVHKFCEKANIEIIGGYTPPKFEAEESQFTLLGGEYE